MKTKKVSAKLAAWLAGQGSYEDLPAADRDNRHLRIVFGNEDYPNTPILQTAGGFTVYLSEVRDALPDILQAIAEVEAGKLTEDYDAMPINEYEVLVRPPSAAKVVVGCGSLEMTFDEVREVAAKVKAYKAPKQDKTATAKPSTTENV
jgi:hypothetical protein